MLIARCEAEPLAERMWHLRHQYTSHDACYIALAEALQVLLHTCDAKFDSRGHHAIVHVHGRTH